MASFMAIVYVLTAHSPKLVAIKYCSMCILVYCGSDNTCKVNSKRPLSSASLSANQLTNNAFIKNNILH